MKDKKFFFAISILLGTIVGAGIFGIPYVIARSGIIPGFFYLLILGGAVLLIHLFFGEIVLRTKEKHRLPGFAQKYLGEKARILIAASTLLAITGALLAYTIIGGDFLKIVFSPFLNLSSFYFSLIFWAILSYFIFQGIKLIAPTQLLMNIAFIFIIFLIFCFALPKINLQNFSLINPENIFLPYGIILFSLIGWSAIPIISEIFENSKERRKIKKVIIVSVIAVIFLYFLFTLSVVGVSGQNTSSEALHGLLPFLGQTIVVLGALFGILAIATSFLILGNYLKNTLFYDFKIPRIISATISCGIPLILFLIGFRGFIEVVGLVGTIVGVIEGVIIVLIFKKAKLSGNRRPEYSLKIPSILLYFLIAIFILGAVSQV
ncbi:MAG: amino acid permease, partial [Candidatus Nealsonbacteria bacterium]